MGERKEKADLEQLLNSLIEKGWKPFGRYKEIFRTDYYEYYVAEEHWFWKRQYLRNLVSIESWLWQFVCENNLVPIMCDEEWIKHYYKDIDDDNLISWENIQPTTEYEYRLIESSLKDESELEDFLLQNIKVDE